MGVLCSACGHDNPIGVRFCAACAAELGNICPECGFENPRGFRFCGQCGANLTTARVRSAFGESERQLANYIPAQLAEKMLRQSAQLKGEHRTATILFADISGYTTVSERLDPEQLYIIMDELLRSFVQEVYRYEGTVDKFTGDGLMALFGAVAAHENDPERAIRAALGMHAALAQLNAKIECEYGTVLQCRVGLNAGEVIVGELGSDLRLDFTVVGDTVNVASRLEKAAEPGTVLVSDAVYRATESIFEFLPMGELVLKGRQAPVAAYRVVGERAQKGRGRGLRGLEAPMVGRQRELDLILRATRECIERGRGQLILVTGEAGIGKSRVTAEWRAALAHESLTHLQSNSVSHTASVPLWAFRDMFRSYFGLCEGEPVEQGRDKLRRKIGVLPGVCADELLPYLASLISPDLVAPDDLPRVAELTPAELRQQTFLSVRSLLIAETARQPVVMALEDIHWMDRPSLDLLKFLLPMLETHRIVFYCISRPDEGRAAPELVDLAKSSFPDRFTEVRLQPLATKDVSRLLDELLRMPDLPEPFRAIIFDRAEGNPFFLEEIIRTMIDRGVLIREAGGGWRAGNMDPALWQVPRTLRGLILARVDALTEISREVLQCAAVIGRSFDGQLLAHVTHSPGVLEGSLRDLVEHGLVDADPAAGERSFTFHHALTQEAVYGTLLTRRKRALHRAVGEGIEALHAGRLQEQTELLAHHFYLADVPDRALRYTIQAGAEAAGRYANELSLDYYERALGLAGRAAATPEQRVAIHAGLGDVRGLLGNYAAALEEYDRALALLAGAGGAPLTERAMELSRKAARALERQGRYDDATHRLIESLGAYDGGGGAAAALERARVHNDLGWVAFRRGDMEEAERWTVRALEQLEPMHSLQDIAAAYNRLAGISYQRGQWEAAARYAERGLALREQIGYTYGLAMSYNNLSVIYMAGGDWTRGILYAEKSLEMKQRMGDVEGVGISYNNLGMAYKDVGDLDRARDNLAKSLATARRIRNPMLLASTRVNLGQVALRAGDWLDAIGYLEDGLQIATESGSKEQVAEAQSLLGVAWVHAGNLERAEQSAEQALATAGECGSRAATALANRSMAELRRAQGRPADAAECLRRSLEDFTVLGNQIEIGRTLLQLGVALADQGELELAKERMCRALDIFTRLGARRDVEDASSQLARWAEHR